MNTLDQLIAKHATEQDVRKRMVSLRDDADELLDTLAKDHASATGLSALDAYDHVVNTDQGRSILSKREEASRFIESQPAQD